MAIKIIKPGKKPETFRFECPHCGCVFEADEDDYRLTSDDDQQNLLAYAICPSCWHIAFKPCNE